MTSSLEQLHNAIETKIKEKFGKRLSLVEWNDLYDDEYKFCAPSIILDMEKVTPLGLDAYDRLEMRCEISAHCILKDKRRAHIKVKEMAARLKPHSAM